MRVDTFWGHYATQGANTLWKVSVLGTHNSCSLPYYDMLVFASLLLVFNPCLTFLHLSWDQRSYI